MAHRAMGGGVSGREWAVCSEGEAGDDGKESRGRHRRCKYSMAAGNEDLLEENCRLYMDNLRLWDCLTIIRGDPALTCQGAINLVFSLDDEDYLRAFPDTNHLFQLRFPHGEVHHSNMEEARSENSRLRDENARLHAAVWVLRDNPMLQADSTVAAIFRLDETQFQYKFHVDLETMNLGNMKSYDSPGYQNNNKARRRSYRASLDMGNELNMAIQLTNRPLKVGYTSRRSRSLSDRGQNGTTVCSPLVNTRKRSGSLAQQKDFTSNWKPTTPKDGERILGLPGEDEFIDRLSRYVSPSYACEPRHRQSSCFWPVYKCTTEGGRLSKLGQVLQKEHQDGKTTEAKSETGCQEVERTNKSDLLNSSRDILIDLQPSINSANAQYVKHFSCSEDLGLAYSESPDNCAEFGQHQNQASVSSQPSTGSRWKATTFSSGSLEKMAEEAATATASITRLLEPSKRHQREIASNPLLLSYSSVLLPPGDVDFCTSNNLLQGQKSALAVPDIKLFNTSSNNKNPWRKPKGISKTSFPKHLKFPDLMPFNFNSNNEHPHNTYEVGALDIITSTSAAETHKNVGLLNKSSNNGSFQTGLKVEGKISSMPMSTIRSKRPLSATPRSFAEARRSILQTDTSSEHKQPWTESPPQVRFTAKEASGAPRIFSESVSGMFTADGSRRISCFSHPPTEEDGLLRDMTILEELTTNLKLKNQASLPIPFGPKGLDSKTKKPVICLSTKSNAKPPEGLISQPYPFQTLTSVKHFLERHRLLQEESTSRCPTEWTEFYTKDLPAWPKIDPTSSYLRWRKSMQAGEEEEKSRKPKRCLTQTYDWFRTGRKPLQPSSCLDVTQPPAPVKPIVQVGKLKGCDVDPACNNQVKLGALKKMGKRKYTKPLAAMLRRNSCHQWQPLSGTNCQVAAKKLAADVVEIQKKSGR